MIIDFHAHIFPDKVAAKVIGKLTSGLTIDLRPATDATAAGLVRYMDHCSVDISVLQPVLTKPEQFRRINDWMLSVASDRLLPFGGLHPDTDDYKRDIDYLVSMGFKGIKLHPEYQNFTLTEPRMLKIYDYALSRGLILLFHAGFDPLYPPPFKSSPRMFASVLDNMRGGTIVAAHLGGHEQWDDVLHFLAGRDIYLDTSVGFQYVPREVFLSIAKRHGADRILFATDSPWSRADEEIASLMSMPLTDCEKELILSENAKRLLGVQLSLSVPRRC